MSFEIDNEYFRTGEDPNRYSNWEYAIIVLANNFGIYKPNKRFYLIKIARFRNENFKKDKDAYIIVLKEYVSLME